MVRCPWFFQPVTIKYGCLQGLYLTSGLYNCSVRGEKVIWWKQGDKYFSDEQGTLYAFKANE